MSGLRPIQELNLWQSWAAAAMARVSDGLL